MASEREHHLYFLLSLSSSSSWWNMAAQLAWYWLWIWPVRDTDFHKICMWALWHRKLRLVANIFIPTSFYVVDRKKKAITKMSCCSIVNRPRIMYVVPGKVIFSKLWFCLGRWGQERREGVGTSCTYTVLGGGGAGGGCPNQVAPHPSG